MGRSNKDDADDDLRNALRHLPQICSKGIGPGKWCVLVRSHGGACVG